MLLYASSCFRTEPVKRSVRLDLKRKSASDAPEIETDSNNLEPTSLNDTVAHAPPEAYWQTANWTLKRTRLDIANKASFDRDTASIGSSSASTMSLSESRSVCTEIVSPTAQATLLACSDGSDAYISPTVQNPRDPGGRLTFHDRRMSPLVESIGSRTPSPEPQACGNAAAYSSSCTGGHAASSPAPGNSLSAVNLNFTRVNGDCIRPLASPPRATPLAHSNAAATWSQMKAIAAGGSC